MKKKCYFSVSMRRAMIKYLLIIIQLLWFTHSFANPDKVKELSNKLANAKDDTTRINIYRDYITMYIIENQDSAMYYINKGKELATKIDNARSLGMLYNSESRVLQMQGDFEKAKSSDLKALEYFYHDDYKLGISTCYNSLGVISAKTGDYKQATSYFLRALKINEDIKNTDGIIQCYISLGTTNSQLDLLEKANKYYFKAMGLLQDSLTTTFLNLCNNIGIVYGKNAEYEKSINYFKRGLKIADKVHNAQATKVSLLMNLAIAYANTERTDLALSMYNQALDISKKYNLVEDQARVLYNIAILYEDSNPRLSESYFTQVLDIALAMGQKHLVVEVYQSLYILQKQAGDYERALASLEKFHIYQDSVMSIENTSAIELLQSNYDLEKSKVEIKELEMANQKQRSNQIIALLVIGGSLFSLGIVTYNSRKRNKLNKELLKSIQVRDKLLSIITHDLKSPINNILGLINELEGEEMSAQERFILLETLKKQTSLSLDTLENILKWGQAQIRGIKTNPQEFNLKELIVHNKELVELNLHSKNLQLNIEVDENIKLNADKDQVDFVVRNLLTNAIKYSNRSSVITIKADSLDNSKVKIDVIDEGIGMTNETLETLFGVHQKINLGTSNERGSGLGLLLCKEFVEANNGKIVAESSLGKGSVFSFTCTSA